MPPIQVGVVMGSSSDWDTLQHAVAILQEFGIAHEARVVSAHRMPDDMFAYAQGAAARGLKAPSVARRLSAIRQLYRFLSAEGHRSDDPAAVVARILTGLLPFLRVSIPYSNTLLPLLAVAAGVLILLQR